MPNSTESRIVIRKAGSYGALELEQYASVPPKNDEVSIKVFAAGVNYADCVIRMGLYKSAKELHGYPITPGFEVAGEITAIGADVTRFKVGDRVIGITLFGGYCSQLCISQEQVFDCPEGMDYAVAASLPTVYLTAWFALHHLAHIQANDRILVHSGAGGVGLAALQLISRSKAHSTAVVGASHKTSVAQDYAASNVIDKSRHDLWATAESLQTSGYDAILDPNGYSTLQDSYNHLAPLGKLVIYGFHSMLPQSKETSSGRPNYLSLARDWFRTPRFNPLAMTADNKSVMAFNLSFLSSRTELMRSAMDDILQGINQQQLKPLPVATYPLEKAATAQRALESAQTTGKLILLPSQPA